MRSIQISDIHEGSRLFEPELMDIAVEEINAVEPNLVAVAGNPPMEGYRGEFEKAKSYLDRLECEDVVVVSENRDSRSVGYYRLRAA